jgi:hypothetical protein
MDYDAVTIQSSSFSMGRAFLDDAMGAFSTPFISLNVVDAETDTPIGHPYFLKKAIFRKKAGPKIALVAVSDPLAISGDQAEIHSSGHSGHSNNSSDANENQRAELGVKMTDPLEALGRHLPEITTQSDLIVLFSPLTPEQNTLIAKRFPEISFIIGNNPHEIYRSTNATLVVGNQSSEGKKVGKLSLTFDQDNNIFDYRIEWLPIDKTYEGNRKIRGLLNDFYDMVAHDKELWEEVEPLFTAFELEADESNKYVGAVKCAPCHQMIFEEWGQSGHAGAYDTLIKKNRYFYPDCINCHVTGAGYAGGFQIERTTKHLEGVQCEVCHGPGGKHVDSGGDFNLRVTSDQRFCEECHDDSVSPDFEDGFDDRLAMMNHSEIPVDVRTEIRVASANGPGSYPHLEELQVEDRQTYELLLETFTSGCRIGHLLFECKQKSASEMRSYLDGLLETDRDIDSLMAKMVEKYGEQVKAGEREINRYLLKQQSVAEAIGYAIEETERATVDLFLGSYEKRGIKTEKILFDLQSKTYGDNLDITLHFLAEERKSDGPIYVRFKSQTGPREIEENIRQLLIQKYEPDKLGDYLSARNRNIEATDWKKNAARAHIDLRLINRKMKSGEGADLLSGDIQLSESKGITDSPTMLINGAKFLGIFPE